LFKKNAKGYKVPPRPTGDLPKELKTKISDMKAA
jgi:hypothetical protein